jgi:hypothetical protein
MAGALAMALAERNKKVSGSGRLFLDPKYVSRLMLTNLDDEDDEEDW